MALESDPFNDLLRLQEQLAALSAPRQRNREHAVHEVQLPKSERAKPRKIPVAAGS